MKTSEREALVAMFAPNPYDSMLNMELAAKARRVHVAMLEKHIEVLADAIADAKARDWQYVRRTLQMRLNWRKDELALVRSYQLLADDAMILGE